jgi:hypothetical protein
MMILLILHEVQIVELEMKTQIMIIEILDEVVDEVVDDEAEVVDEGRQHQVNKN